MCWLNFLTIFPLLEIILHDLPQRSHLLKISEAHRRSCSGLAFSGSNKLLSCGVDQTVRLWDVGTEYDSHDKNADEEGEVVHKVSYFRSRSSHHIDTLQCLEKETPCCIPW